MRTVYTLLLFAAPVGVVCGCGNEAPAGRTPQLALDAFGSAIKNKDYKTAFVQTTPQSQEQQLAIMAVVAPLAAKSADDHDRKTAQAIQAILDRYGIRKNALDGTQSVSDAAATLKSQIEAMKRKAGCVGEIFQVIDAEAKHNKYFGIDLDRFGNSKLLSVAIDGQRATGSIETVTTGNTHRSETIMFQKIDDFWFIDLVETLRGK